MTGMATLLRERVGAEVPALVIIGTVPYFSPHFHVATLSLRLDLSIVVFLHFT